MSIVSIYLAMVVCQINTCMADHTHSMESSMCHMNSDPNSHQCHRYSFDSNYSPIKTSLSSPSVPVSSLDSGGPLAPLPPLLSPFCPLWTLHSLICTVEDNYHCFKQRTVFKTPTNAYKGFLMQIYFTQRMVRQMCDVLSVI